MLETKKIKNIKVVVGIILSTFALGSVAYSLLNKSVPQASENANTKAATISVAQPSQPAIIAATQIPQSAKRHILVRYFHTTARCVSCKKIEAYTNEAITSAFTTELQDGRLIWTSLNIEMPGFEHFIQDFQLTNKSIVVTEENTKNPRQWKNLNRIWEILGNKDAFISYVQQEIRTFLVGV